MKVLVIVVIYNGVKWLDKCLGSVMKSLIPLDVFIVDNDSSDGTLDYIKGHYPEVIMTI